MRIQKEEAAARLMAARRLLITAHMSPDGDAVGSSLALAAFLRARGREAAVWIDDALPRNLSFLPGYDAIRRPDGSPLSGELLVVLDTDLSRIGAVGTGAQGLPVLNIDHHISNDGRADFLWNGRFSATAEMVFDLLDHLGSDFPPEIAVPLYTGLATDTGFFKYSNTRPETMRAAARLLEAGVRPEAVSEALEEKTLALVEGQAAALRTMELSADGRVAGLYLDRELAQSLETTDGFIDLVRVIEGVEVAVLVKCMDENFCRASLRSKGLDVSRIAMRFGGGGHIRAAGCTFSLPLAEAKAALLAAVSEALAGA